MDVFSTYLSEMQPFFLLFSICYDVYTCGDTERIHETKRMQIKYLTNYVLLPLPEEGERHEEGNSQITDDNMLVAEFLRRLENSNELL